MILEISIDRQIQPTLENLSDRHHLTVSCHELMILGSFSAIIYLP
ncbi:hypothetical protein [Pseudanabaena sp. UWO310]|nr:hypothetical protein [Pseudanabaena sp. UWO310]